MMDKQKLIEIAKKVHTKLLSVSYNGYEVLAYLTFLGFLFFLVM